MMTSKPARPSFSSSSSALLAVPYSVTPGESRNFDLTTSSQNVSTGSTSDPAYLFSQVNRLIVFNKGILFIFVFLTVKKC
jgi:hypothetical protein